MEVALSCHAPLSWLMLFVLHCCLVVVVFVLTCGAVQAAADSNMCDLVRPSTSARSEAQTWVTLVRLSTSASTCEVCSQLPGTFVMFGVACLF